VGKKGAKNLFEVKKRGKLPFQKGEKEKKRKPLGDYLSCGFIGEGRT